MNANTAPYPTPYQEGWTARVEGRPMTTCPYVACSQDAQRWFLGWTHANKDIGHTKLMYNDTEWIKENREQEEAS